MPRFGIKTVVIILTAVVVTVALGWAYSEHRKRELHEAVAALVKDTSLRLRETLSIKAGSTSADIPQSGRKFDDHVAAVERHLQKLRGMDTASLGALAEPADDFVLTGREILRRVAASHRYRLQLSGSLQALRDHMRADDRSGSWVQEAVRAKERVEEDYRNYKFSVEALGKLLESFPASRAKMAPYVDAALLTDESLIDEARRRALEAATHAADEIEKARQLEAYR